MRPGEGGDVVTLIGRDYDLAQIEEAIDRHRLVTVTGPGGVGKTSLARSVLEGWIGPGGFADLTQVSSDRILDGIAGLLGFTSFDVMPDLIGTDGWLVVVDNCEHLLDPAASAVDAMLRSCETLTILATSREPLAVPDEVVVPLAPLSLHGSPSPAASLFLERAAARGVSLEADMEAVQLLCEDVDGLPLAIELAAAKSTAFTPAEISRRLSESLETLRTERARGPERHRSLRAAIAWSFDQLEPPLGAVLARLALFEGWFSVDMASAVADELVPDVHEVLAVLTDRSLLVRRAIGPASWFRFLDTIRTFADERLDASGDREQTWERIVDHVVTHLRGLGEIPVMSEAEPPPMLEVAFPTVRAVAASLLQTDDRSDRALSMATPMWWLEDLGHQAEVADLLQAMIDRWPEPVPAAGPAYGIASAFQRLLKREAEARANGQIALVADDPVGCAFGHRSLGQMARRRRDWTSAQDHLYAGSAVARAAGQLPLALELEMHAAMTIARAGDPQGGVQLLENLEVEARPFPLCHNWIRLFLAWLLMADTPTDAREIARAVLSERDHVASGWAQAMASAHCGVADALEGEMQSAAAYLSRAIEALRSINNVTDIVLVYSASSAVLRACGQWEAALEAFALANRLIPERSFGEFETQIYESISPVPTGYDPSDKPSWPAVREALRAVAAGECSDATEAQTTDAAFIFNGDLWELGFAGVVEHVSDLKGMHDIASLIRRPGAELPALDLIDAGVVSGSAGVASDDEARRAYRHRVETLTSEREDAVVAGDLARVERVEAELDQLMDHLGRAYGLAGRGRSDGETAERARSAVTWRIRAAIKRIREVHPDLAQHLDASINTGRYCSYNPSEQVIWRL